MATPIDPETWERYAEGMKAAFTHWGLRTDTAVTGDRARILRAPGGFNCKLGRHVPVVMDGDFFNAPQDSPLGTFDPLLAFASATVRQPSKGENLGDGELFTGSIPRDDATVDYWTRLARIMQHRLADVV